MPFFFHNKDKDEALDAMVHNNTFGPFGSGGGTVHAGHSFHTAGGNVYIETPDGQRQPQHSPSSRDTEFLRAWCLTDPRDDRQRILASKDPLLEGSCDWIFRDPAFTQWWSDDDSRILWIHGDPGKGKTMMMMALTEEIARRLRDKPGSGVVSFFFCQNAARELSNSTAIVRGLTFLLAAEQPTLRKHLAKKCAEAGERLFEGFNVLQSLWNTLLDIAQDEAVPRVYLLVDALDECDTDSIRAFLTLLTRGTSTGLRKIKWVLSSRNETHISQRLQRSQDTSLELNSKHVTAAVMSFIAYKVDQLACDKSYNPEVCEAVRAYLNTHADGTFLWVALVCKEMEEEDVYEWNVQSTMEQFPSGLEPLYGRMLQHLYAGKKRDLILHRLALICNVTIARRPLHINEIGHLAGFPSAVINHSRAVSDLVSSCGSFLTMREGIVNFVHKSAKDYFTTGTGSSIFQVGQTAVHGQLAQRLLDFMSRLLKKDMGSIGRPGMLVSEIDSETVQCSLPRHLQYACCHWVDHIMEGKFHFEKEGRLVYSFLQEKLLFWLEALSLIGRLSDGVHMLSTLRTASKVS